MLEEETLFLEEMLALYFAGQSKGPFMKYFAIAFFVLTSIVGCARHENVPEEVQVPTPLSGTIPVYRGEDLTAKAKVERFIDGDAGVVCYRNVLGGGHYTEPLSCVALSHTSLRLDGSSRVEASSDSKAATTGR